MRKERKPNICEKPKGSGKWFYRTTWTGANGKRSEKYTRLPPPNTPEHDREYWAIRSGKANLTVSKTSWDKLAKLYFGSSNFRKKKESTRKPYRRYINQLIEKNGPKDILATRRSDILAIHERYADTPRKADWFVQVISILFTHAIKLEWTTHNPAKGIELFGTTNPFQPWPQALQKAFEGSSAGNVLTAYHLGTGTGQRPGDLVKMKWAHFDGEFMAVTQEKTDARLWVYCPQRLRAYLSALPRSGDYILAKNLREPLTYDAIEKAFRKARDGIETNQRLTMHGWRYTAAVELAEAGCSDAEIQSVTGHKTLEMVQKYRNQARQKQLSKDAQIRRDQKERNMKVG